jgi:hypothetical protein
MALLLNQVVRVRVAIVADVSAGDLSVGQVWDDAAAAWADVVWIDVASSTALPQEFGDVEFLGEVNNLALTRSGTTRPSVRLRAWYAGGFPADGYTVLSSGNAYGNTAQLTRGGANVTTNLPALGSVANRIRIIGQANQRVGWTGVLPRPLVWNAGGLSIRKRIAAAGGDTYEQQYLAGMSGFAADLAAWNAWLAANQPEYGTPLTIGARVAFNRNRVSGGWTYWYGYVGAFTLHLSLGTDYSTWGWTARGMLLRHTTMAVSVNVCGGRTGVQAFYGDTYTPGTANAASLMAGAHQYATLSGFFSTPPAAGGVVTASPRAALYNGGPTYGVDVALSVSAQGRVTGVALIGVSSDGAIESVTAWGACKMEGGLLA